MSIYPAYSYSRPNLGSLNDGIACFFARGFFGCEILGKIMVRAGTACGNIDRGSYPIGDWVIEDAKVTAWAGTKSVAKAKTVAAVLKKQKRQSEYIRV